MAFTLSLHAFRQLGHYNPRMYAGDEQIRMLGSEELDEFELGDLGRGVCRRTGRWALAGSNLHDSGVDADDRGGRVVSGEERLNCDDDASYVCLPSRRGECQIGDEGLSIEYSAEIACNHQET